MKRVIFLLMTIALVPLVSAQVGVGFGIKAGANFVNQAIEDIDSKTVTDFHVGGYLNLNFTEQFGVTPEVLFSAQGCKTENGSEKVRVNYDYIAIPVMLRFKPIPVLKLEAGPQFSFLTKAEVEGIGDVKEQLKNNDFGLAFGAGVLLPFGLNGGVRYVLGFTNISDVAEEEIRNRTFQIYLGWTILGAK